MSKQHRQMDTQTLGPATSDSSQRGSDLEQPEAEGLPILAPGWFLLVAAVFMLASATFDTSATKYMNKQELPRCDGCKPVFFEAPMFQTLTGYVGQLVFLPIYFLDSYVARKRDTARKLDLPTSHSDFKKPHCPVWIWIFPLLLDFISTSCLNYSTMLAQASTVQMLRSSNIVIAFLLSAFALKNRIYIHQIFGVLLVFLGLMLVAIYAILNPDEETNYKNLQWLGIVTALAGTGFSAFQWVLEEIIFRRYYCSPFEGVGWMGFYGCIVGGIMLGVFQAAGWEDVKGAFYQMGLGKKESTILIAFNLSYIVSLSINTASGEFIVFGCIDSMLLCFTGITVTKLGSSLLRTIVNAGRTVSMWLIELIVGWSRFAVLNFVGLILISIAMGIYNYNYFTDKEGHWPGDRFFRKSAACLPNKYEVTNKDSAALNGVEQKEGQELRRRKNSEQITARSERPASLELGSTTAA